VRLPVGGRVQRGEVLRFSLDGVRRTGLRGDTLASALVADGALRVGDSPYRRRPRGILTADAGEPNAFVEVAGLDAMRPATTVELVDGLEARTLSGKGRLDPADPAPAGTYDKTYRHAEVAVVGGGPAGIRAALEASADGDRVLLVADDSELGGSLLAVRDHADQAWLAGATAELARRPEVTILTRTSAIGLYDHGHLVALERRTHHLDSPPPALSRERLWHVRARRVVLATGAQQRPLVFAGNDRPGVMLAGAVRTYLNRYAAVPGERVVVATTDDSGYETALDLVAAGVAVPLLADARRRPPPALVALLTDLGVDVAAGTLPTATHGDPALTAVELGGRTVACDVLAVSGGWNPDLALFAQAGGTLRWDDARAAFLPDGAPPGVTCVGGASGVVPPGAFVPYVAGDGDPATWTEHFLDLQRDSTVADVHRAHGAGMRSVEHVKRYTTIGTGSEQGRTSGVNAAGVLAAALGLGSPAELGMTGFRPPAVPVSFAAMAGRDVGHLADPARRTAIHDRHVAAGAVFEDVGQWKRPRFYPRPGEDMAAAVRRECTAARTGVAMMDVSTLGRIEVVGRDAPVFLDRMYTNAFAKLAVGAARYGVMCTADGMVLDDGVVIRLADDRYHLTTTTGNAATVLAWLEEWLQTEWPELDVALTSVTERMSTVAVVGPRSRDVVAHLAPQLDCGNDAFGFMTFRETVLADGIPARVARISFSGELAFEVSVAAWYGTALWDAVADAGAGAGTGPGITPYGTETMHVLRAEKAYPIVGQDTDGTVTPIDLGMAWVVSKRKDFVGKRSLRRPDTARPDRKQLVALLPTDPDALLPEGAQLVADDDPRRMLGHVTSSYRSAVLGRTFALALVERGRERVGESLLAPLARPPIRATVAEPVLVDPEGARRDG
jgi:sarcosine oxidase subunit alpha